MELLIGLVLVLAVLWWLGRDAPVPGPPPREPPPPAPPPARPRRVPPPAGPRDPRELREDHDDAAFIDGAVFGWLAYREWFDDEPASSDGWAESEIDGDGLDDDFDGMYDDDFDDFGL